MKYVALLQGKERELEVLQLNNQQYRVTLDGKSFQVDAQMCDINRISLLTDNFSADISYVIEKNIIQLAFCRQNFEIKIMDEYQKVKNNARAEKESSGSEIIKSSMPGKIVKLLVKEGQEVRQGEGIIIIEAMKMENEIKCQKSGIVDKIHVKAPDNVEGGQVLVEISSETKKLQ